MLTQSFAFISCLALIGCDQRASEINESDLPTTHMSKPIDFGVETYRRTIATLEPQVDYGPNGESQDAPWDDTPKFRKWIESLNLGDENTEALLELVPPVSMATNHGPLLGVERFMEDNSESRHMVREAGFLIFASGPNGDFVVVDTRDGGGQTGWLPMAMIWDMEPSQVREHFVATNKNLGDFLRASEEDWSEVPKDWYDARDESAKTQ